MTARLCLLLALLLVGCAPSAPGGTVTTIEVTGQVVAGPTCPVVSKPPDPACDERPVEGAELRILDENGEEVARALTDQDGRFSISLPPGSYQLVPQPVEGLMGTAAPIELVIRDGEALKPLLVAYDTGIR